MERSFGTELSGVRVHIGPEADALTGAARARAVTAGEHIAFGRGAYAPRQSEGRHLLAHELTHVVQQRASVSTAVERLGGRHEAFETEASRVADSVARGDAAPAILGTLGGALARQELEPLPEEAPSSTLDADTVDEGEDFAPVEAPFTHSISTRDPSVVWVPATATREVIARELSGGDISAFYLVGPAEARPPAEDQQGIRYVHPTRIPAAVMTEMRTQLDALLTPEVDATVRALVDRTGGWSAAEHVLRWSQYSAYTDSGGRGYFDRFLDALDSRTIRTTTNYVLWSSSSSRSALDELLAETSGDVNAAVRRARARSGRATSADRLLAGATTPLPMMHVVGRWMSGRDNAAVAAHVVQVLVPGAERLECEIRTRNSSFLGPKVMILGDNGWWYGYGLWFDVNASGTLLPPVIGSPEENGRFYWYDRTTVFFGAGEHDPNGPADEPLATMVQRQVLDEALSSRDPRALIALDYGVIRQSSVEERVRIFRRIADAGLTGSSIYGYTTRHVAETLARVVMASTPEEFLQLERALDREGLTARLMRVRDSSLAPLGAAFTFQSLAATQLGPQAFAEPTLLSRGSANASSSIDYYLAQPHARTSRVVAPGEWDPSATVTAAGGHPTEPGLPGEATGDIARTTVSFEHGTAPTDWQDRSAWSRRSSATTREFLPTELLTIESVSPTGRRRRVASAFEAALTQGDPESEVSHESFMDFMNVVLIAHGGAGLMRLGSIGARAMAAGSLRAAMSVLAEQLASQTGRTAVRSLVDVALFNALRYAQQHQEELDRTPEGRAFVAAVTAATVVLAARDVSRLIESGALTRVLATGRAALGVVGDAARLAVRRTLQNFRAAELAWARLEQEGLILQTTVGGVRMRVPRSPADFANAYRVGQAQAAGEELMAAIGTGGPGATRASSVLDRLERGAGGFQRPAGAGPLTEAETEAARAYRDIARYATGLASAEREAFFAAAERLLSSPGRSATELAPFLRSAARAASRGADATAYLDAATWLASSPISREGLARLAANSVGRRPVDLVWLRGTSLTPDDLDFLARDPHTPWGDFLLASRVPAGSQVAADIMRVRRALRGTRGAAAEMVARDQAATLVPGFRVRQRQVAAGASEIDFELVSTDRLARVRPLEVKGWTSQNWSRSFDAFARRAAGEVLTDSMEIAGANQLEGMVTQLRNATSIASRGESPVLAVTSAMGTAERAALRDLLVSRGLGNVEVVFLPEAEILGAGRRLRTAMGF